jgi:putative addiction module component (TIGR02574 family)
MGLEDLESEALKLNLAERALLAERLFLSLDAPAEEENLRLWVVESERRIAELRAGTVEEIPKHEVMRRARAAIR